MTFSIRLASNDDCAELVALLEASIDQLQRGFLSPAQIKASRAVMGLDQQLITDRTYYLVEHGDRLAGGGGWSRRATLYGGDHSKALRDARLLDPALDPARIRPCTPIPISVDRGSGG